MILGLAQQPQDEFHDDVADDETDDGEANIGITTWLMMPHQ